MRADCLKTYGDLRRAPASVKSHKSTNSRPRWVDLCDFTGRYAGPPVDDAGGQHMPRRTPFPKELDRRPFTFVRAHALGLSVARQLEQQASV